MGQHLSCHKGGDPTLILEAVADYRLWIWHAYFVRLNNVLYYSPLFNDLLNGVALVIEFTVNDHPYHMGYYRQWYIPKVANFHEDAQHAARPETGSLCTTSRGCWERR